MKRIHGALAVTLLIALFTATSAYANHTHVGSSVRVVRGTTDVVTPYLSQDPVTGLPLLSCSSTLCETPVPMSGRDHGRFVRWCGAASQAVNIPSGSTFAVVVCPGPGSWALRVAAALNDCSAGPCVTTTHSSDVQVIVNAVGR